MAIKRGVKRASVGGDAASKERSVKQRCAAVAKTLASCSAGHAGKLLAGMAESALLTYKEDRHQYQKEVIKSMQSAMVAKQEELKHALSEQSTLIGDPDAERANRQQQVEAAVDKVKSLTESVEEKKAELKTQAAATQDATEKAKAAKQAAKLLIKKKDAAEGEKAEMEEALQLLGSACGVVVLNRIQKLAKQLRCDKAMLDALPAAAKHGEEGRTDFQKTTVKALKDRIAEQVAVLAATLEKDRPLREEQESAIRETESARTAADAASKATQAALDELHKELATEKQTLKAAEKKLAHFLPDMKRLMDNFDKTKADLAALVEGPVADFAMLEAYTAPPEPEAEAVPAEQALPAEELEPAE